MKLALVSHSPVANQKGQFSWESTHSKPVSASISAPTRLFIDKAKRSDNTSKIVGGAFTLFMRSTLLPLGSFIFPVQLQVFS
jgi:hypothetical protein